MKIKKFRYDIAKELCYREIVCFFVEERSVHETNCAYALEKNDVAERKIGIIMEKAMASFLQILSPKVLWREEILIVI